MNLSRILVGTALVVVAACTGSDAGSVSDDTVAIGDRSSLDDSRSLWEAARPDGYRISSEGDLGDREISTWIVVDGVDVIENSDEGGGLDLSVEGMYRLLDDAFAAGREAQASADRYTGLLADIEIELADGRTIDITSIGYDAFERDDGCAPGEDPRLDLSEEPIRFEVIDDQDRFVDEDGCAVRRDVVVAFDGPEHCDWESVEFIVIEPGWDLPAGGYVFDGDDVLGGFDAVDRGQRVSVDDLPNDASDTGLRLDGDQLWTASDDDAVYLVDDDGARRFGDDADVYACA